MKGDFSRQTFDPRRHYDGVLMQQGRVQVDADWNEQDAISRYRDELAAVDTIGRCGGPIHAAGFEITSEGGKLLIGQGRYWVDGILVENDLGVVDTEVPPAGKLLFDEQPYLPGESLEKVLAILKEVGVPGALAYLDVWQRHVTALEDPRLREVALGGPDTTTRVQTVWQVKLLPLASTERDPAARKKLFKKQKKLQEMVADTDKAAGELAAQVKELETKLASLPANSGAARAIETQLKQLKAQQAELAKQAEQLAADLAEIEKALSQLEPGVEIRCDGPISGWDGLTRRPGLLNARAQAGDPADDPCELPPGGGYTRLENQLYRVEIHRGGNIGQATFKWSRDNGTVVAAIEQISGSVVRVDTLGPDDVLGFATGQWVELLDDRLELLGERGQLSKIIDVNTATREVELTPAPQPLAGGPTGVDLALRPRLRRWDQTGASATVDGVLSAAGWLALEDGVEVQFSQPAGTTFTAGDYWLIPARTATADLQWPPYETPNLNPQPQGPLGIEHHFCRLALLGVDGEKLIVVEDCRHLYPPLTEICCTRDALHVDAINWENDGLLPLAAVADPGLRITLDAAPDPASVSNDSVLVTYDSPFRPGDTVVPNVRERLVLLGDVGIDPNDPRTIVWRFAQVEEQRPGVNGGAVGPGAPGAGGATGGGAAGGGTTEGAIGGINIARPPILGGLFVRREIGERALASTRAVERVSVTLRGSFIWLQEGRKRRYLDGQTLGEPVADATTKLTRTGLALPSGDGRRASDFEGWFYIGRGRQTNTLRVSAVTFRTTFGAAPRDVLTVGDLLTDPDKPAQFAAKETVNVVRVVFNRAVAPEGSFKVGQPQPLLVELLVAGAGSERRFGPVTVKGDTAEFDAQDPEVLKEPGNYRLTVFAEQTDIGPGVTAQDDNTALDGDYDGQPGAHFVMAFRITPD